MYPSTTQTDLRSLIACFARTIPYTVLRLLKTGVFGELIYFAQSDPFIALPPKPMISPLAWMGNIIRCRK